MKRIVIVAAVLLGAASSSQAQAPTAETLLAICSRKPDDRALCITYLKGFAGGNLMAMLLKNEGRSICLPDGTTGEQLRNVVTSFITARPNLAKLDSNAAIGVALSTAFPCKAKN